AAVLAALPDQYRPLAGWASEAFGRAAGIGMDTLGPSAGRLAAVHLLAHAPWDVAGPVLTKLLTDEPDQAVRLAAVGALAAQPGAASAEALLRPWRSHSPAVRREAISALVRQPDRALQ